MTKRFLALLLALVMCFSLAACGGDKGNEEKDDEKVEQAEDKKDEGEKENGENELPGTPEPEKPKYKITSIEEFSNGYAIINADTGKGFIDTTGKVTVEPIYKYVNPFCNGLSCVQLGDKYGYIDTSGNVVIDIIYDSASFSFDTLMMLRKDGVTYFANTTGDIVYTSTGEENAIGAFKNGAFWVETMEELINGNQYTMTYYDEKGEVLFSLKDARHIDDISPRLQDKIVNPSGFNEYGYALVCLGTPDANPTQLRYAFIDNTGKVAEWVDEALPEHYESLFPVNKNFFSCYGYPTSSFSAMYNFYIDFENEKMYKTYSGGDCEYLGNDYYYTPYGHNFGQEYDNKLIIRANKSVLNLSKIDAFSSAAIDDCVYTYLNGKDCFWVRLKSSSGVLFTSLIDVDGNVLVAPTNKYDVFIATQTVKNKAYDTYGNTIELIKAEDTETQKIGYLDATGNWALEPVYRSNSTDFYGMGDDAVAVVNRTMIINSKGEVIFDLANQ